VVGSPQISEIVADQKQLSREPREGSESKTHFVLTREIRGSFLDPDLRSSAQISGYAGLWEEAKVLR
jgi:hypothetical protein